MSDEDDGIGQYVDRAAALIKLPVSPAARPAVIANFRNMMQLCRVAIDGDGQLPDDPPGVFRP